MPAPTGTTVLTGALTTQLVSDYRNVDKMGVFGGSAQALIQHFGKTMAIMLPHTEFERLCGRAPKVACSITTLVTAGEIQQRPGSIMLGVKGGTQVVGITRHSELRAVLLPYGVWSAMKMAAKEPIPEPDVVISKAK